MNKLLSALAVVTLLAGCTIQVPTEDDLLDALNRINVDKETALAYTELAMKQAGMATAAMSAGATKSTSAQTAPLYSKLAVTAEQCMIKSEFRCGEKTCSYTEDYSACGEDFSGKIVRTFEEDTDTYKITVNFDAYAEKASSDTGHFAFDGTSVLTGTLGVASANLSMHTEGDTAYYLDGRLVHIKSSADTNFTFLNGALSINGTQTGTIVESGQAASISITELTFDDSCDGPVAGEVKTVIDAIESVAAITACGQGTLTVGGKADVISTNEIQKTFVPDYGGNEDAGFEGLVAGTSAGRLLEGEWYSISPDQTTENWLSIYAQAGTLYFDFWHIEEIDDAVTFETLGISDQYGYGTIAFEGDKVSLVFDFYDEYYYDRADPLTPIYYLLCDGGVGQFCSLGPLPYTLSGSTLVVEESGGSMVFERTTIDEEPGYIPVTYPTGVTATSPG